MANLCDIHATSYGSSSIPLKIPLKARDVYVFQRQIEQDCPFISCMVTVTTSDNDSQSAVQMILTFHSGNLLKNCGGMHLTSGIINVCIICIVL